MGVHGLAIDNVTQVEVVTADGQVRIVNADVEPDLFWALRGGGGNFGVAASFEFQTHPLDVILGGLVAHPLAAAPEVYDMFRQFTKELPDEATVVLRARPCPGRQRDEAVCHPVVPCRAAGEGRGRPGTAARLRASRVGPRRTDAVPRGQLDARRRLPRGALNYWKAAFFTELSDAAVQTMIAAFEASPSIMSAIVVEHFHGEMCRIAPTATAFPHREPGYNLVLIGAVARPGRDRGQRGVGAETYAALEPFMAPKNYVNYLADDEGDLVANAYGPNLARLVEVKRQYDPDNLFRLNHNIDPAG